MFHAPHSTKGDLEYNKYLNAENNKMQQIVQVFFAITHGHISRFGVIQKISLYGMFYIVIYFYFENFRFFECDLNLTGFSSFFLQKFMVI